jgi:CheY-like chemotaxis protein
LVVEDIESNFAQLNILLKKEYIILWVRNRQEAINSFIREKPDLILMDIRMSVMEIVFKLDAMQFSPNHILWRN